jgi:hypothetical protein
LRKKELDSVAPGSTTLLEIWNRESSFASVMDRPLTAALVAL